MKDTVKKVVHTKATNSLLSTSLQGIKRDIEYLTEIRQNFAGEGEEEVVLEGQEEDSQELVHAEGRDEDYGDEEQGEDEQAEEQGEDEQEQLDEEQGEDEQNEGIALEYQEDEDENNQQEKNKDCHLRF